MPAYIPAKARRVSNGLRLSGESEAGLPYISGLLILNDPETGIPLAVMDATWITAQRTGAATAVAAKYLARADSRTAASSPAACKGAAIWRLSPACCPSRRSRRMTSIQRSHEGSPRK